MASKIEQPVINIITRTSNRPIFFSECQQSIQIQSYPNELIRRYVTFDDESNLDGYIQQYNNLIVMEMEREKRKNQTHFPYHLYLDEVIKYIGENGPGWIIILDDDNQLTKNNCLEIIAKNIIDGGNDPNKFYIWRCQHSGRLVPSENSFEKVPKAGDLHISCFIFHHTQAHLVNFEPKRGAEADVIAKLFNQLNCVWINDVLTQTQGSGNGTRQDKTENLMQEEKKKITLKPVSILPLPNKNDIKPAQMVDVDKMATTSKLSEQKNNALPAKIKLKPAALEMTNPSANGIKIEKIEEEEEEEENEGEYEEGDEEGDEDDEEEIANEENVNDSDEEVITGEEPVKEDIKQKSEINSSFVKSLPLDSNKLQIDEKPIFNEETTNILIQLVNLLKSGKRIYILDENNMQKLSKCVKDALTCIEFEDRLVKIFEQNYLEKQVADLQEKLRSVEKNKQMGKPLVQLPQPEIIQNSENGKLDRLLNSSKSINNAIESVNQLQSGTEFIDKIYIITDDNSNKNSALERNKKILSKSKYNHEILSFKNMNLLNYQNQIKEALKDAKNKNYRRVMVINGNDLLNNKFVDLLNKQIEKIKTDCYLWFLGNCRETPVREILGTRFDMADYLFLYDDIVNAKLTTDEKAKTHWKTYGYREARYASIEAINGISQGISNNYGFVVAVEIYDTIIDLINKQTMRDCKNVVSDLMYSLIDPKTIWRSQPDLIIPQFHNQTNHSKNGQIAIRNGWYYNFYK